MDKYKRIFVVVLDSLGIGQMHDSSDYGDINVNTLGHIAEAVGGLNIPNLKSLGISNLIPLKNVPEEEKPLGY